MTAAPARAPMTAEQFLAWAIDRPEGERYELVEGEPVPMSPERSGHALTKLRLTIALQNALLASGHAGDVYGDGMAVRVDEHTVYEPDAQLRLGPTLDPDDIVVVDPLIVAEVVSPRSRNLDTIAKRDGYFRIPTVRHYLILSIGSRMVTHHRRDEAGAIQTRILREGALRLDPPGLVLDVPSLFP